MPAAMCFYKHRRRVGRASRIFIAEMYLVRAIWHTGQERSVICSTLDKVNKARLPQLSVVKNYLQDRLWGHVIASRE